MAISNTTIGGLVAYQNIEIWGVSPAILLQTRPGTVFSCLSTANFGPEHSRWFTTRWILGVDRWLRG